MRANLDKDLQGRGRAGMGRWTARAAGLVCLLCAIVVCARVGAAAQAAGASQPAAPAQSTAPAQTTAPAAAPDAGKPKKGKQDKDDETAQIASWLMIDVVGGADKVPVAEASVYVRFTEVHKVGKDKKMEFDLKTNQEGVARAPDIPHGKVEIQIVATGWASFGQIYDVEQDQQTIHIELERPPRWY
jgi:hypothetical protein